MARYILYIVTLILLTCCNNRYRSISNSDFLDKEELGLYTDNKSKTYVYNKSNYQIAQNRERGSIRIQKDNQSSYIHIQELEQASESQRYLLNITVSLNGATSTKAHEMINVKNSQDKIWLWSEESKIGVILPISFTNYFK